MRGGVVSTETRIAGWQGSEVFLIYKVSGLVVGPHSILFNAYQFLHEKNGRSVKLIILAIHCQS